MASVKSVSFTCPNCSKVLRASARPPAGKKIKCPACSVAFVPELDDEEAATKIQDRPRVKAKPVPSRSNDDDEDEKPRNKKSRADDEESDRPRKKRSDDDDDDEEDDDRRDKKKGKKKSGGGMLMIILAVVFLGGGGLLGCIGCGAGAYFFWPSGNNELLAYVSPDANLIVGGRPKELKTKFAGFKDMFGQAAMQANDPFPEFEDLVLNSEQFLMFANTNNFGFAGPPQQKVGMVMAFKAEQADIDRLRNSKRLGPAKNVGGHSIHKMNAAADGPDFIAFNGRHVVMSDLDEDKFRTVLDRGKKPPASSAAIDLSRSVDRSPMWVAFTFSGEVKKQLRMAVDAAGQKVPSMAAAAPAFESAKGLTFTMDVVGANDLKMTASVMCKDSTDAGKVKTGLDDGWKVVKGLMDGWMLLEGPPPGPQAEAIKLVLRDLGKLSFTTSSNNATATLTFSNQTIDELAKAAKNNPFGGFGGGFNPPPKIDGINKDFPKIDGIKKDFPKFDGIKKDFPKFDGIKDFGPKDFPKKKDGFPKTKGKLIQTFTHMNINANDKRESVIQLQQGKHVTVTMVSTTKGFADVDLFVFSGAPGGDPVGGDATIGPNGTVSFVVPQTGPYRIVVQNLGQGVASRSIVSVYEQ